jgi:hypothetical protein
VGKLGFRRLLWSVRGCLLQGCKAAYERGIRLCTKSQVEKDHRLVPLAHRSYKYRGFYTPHYDEAVMLRSK